MLWKINQIQDKTETVDQLIQRFLKGRNLSTDSTDIDNFLNPAPLTLEYLLKETGINKDQLNKAVSLIVKSIETNRPIIVYGDYDVDGVSASAILWQTLYSIKASAKPFIPHRLDHGYGLSEAGLTAALEPYHDGPSPLIITVDNGITGAKLIKKYQDLGVDFIVTDHHQTPGEAPTSVILLHSTAVCGTAIAFILSFALKDKLPPLDLVALATVCDQLPLIGLNRQLVMQGLMEIRSPARLGLRVLLEQAGIADFSIIDTYHLGFVIGPRINAAGRLGHALDALKLFCTSSPDRAYVLATSLSDLNSNRQDLTQSGLSTAFEKVASYDQLPPVLVVDSPDFHEGIIGLIAAKLTDKYHRPSVVISRGEEVAKGSARSVSGVNITSLLRDAGSLLLDIGGHEGAAGFTLKVDNINPLEKKLMALGEMISPELLLKAVEVDLQLHPNQDLNEVNAALKKLAPFGFGFSSPLLSFESLRVNSQRIVGSNHSHLQLTLRHPNSSIIPGICFNQANSYSLKQNDQLSVAFYLQENTYRDRTSLQLNIQHLKPYELSGTD